MNKLIIITVFSMLLTISKSSALSGNYEIINRNSGMVLEVPAAATNDGANCDQWVGNGGTHQQWTFTDLGTGYYKIINLNSGKALEGKGWGTTNGVIVDQWTYESGNNQQWAITDLGGGLYKLVNRNNSPMVLEVAGWNVDDGGAVDEWTYASGNNQIWYVVPTSLSGTITPSSGGSGVAADTFQGFNWADPDDNFQDGPILPTGLTNTESYASVESTASLVLGAFQNDGANTVRIPINPETVLGTWWGSYKGAIDQATSMGMKLVISAWDSSGQQDGKIDSMVCFLAMWDKVVTDYNGNGNVYFEIFNEPWKYTNSDWLNIVSSWKSRYTTVAAGRIFIQSPSQNIPSIATSSATTGCLFSVHDYGTYNPSQTNTTFFYDDLSTRVGSYASRTVLTEFGANMCAGYNYLGGSIGNNTGSMIGFADYCHDAHMGSILWYGVRYDTGSTFDYALYTYSAMSVNSPSGLGLIQYGWDY